MADEPKRVIDHEVAKAWWQVWNGEVQTYGDCVSCDGYVLNESETPHCPTCARLLREGTAK